MADKEFLSPVTLAVLKLKNAANTFTNLFSNTTTAARTWTLPDKSGTFAMLDDVLSTAATGLSVSAGTLSATDTILQLFNKIAGLIDNDGWVSYTPSLSGITLGNGTLTGKYKKIGKTVFYRVELVFGSTTSITGTVNIGLPVSLTGSTGQIVGDVSLLDANFGYYRGAQLGSANIVYTTTVNSLLAAITATAPFTWTTNDAIITKGFYETT